MITSIIVILIVAALGYVYYISKKAKTTGTNFGEGSGSSKNKLD